MHAAPLRFAILHDDARFERWQILCLEALSALSDVRAEMLITLRSASCELPRPLAGVAQTVLVRTPENDDLQMEGAALARLKSSDLDFVLSFADVACPADLMRAPRYGVWSFQFGDWTRYRGGPAGFWEVYDGASVSSALLTRLLPDLNAVQVLRDGHYRTDTLSYRANRDNILARIIRWPAQVCLDIRNGAISRFNENGVRGAAHVRSAPTRRQLFICRCRIAARTVEVAWRSLFRHDQWNVGLVDQPIAAFLQPQSRAPVHWLPSPKREELRADPFGVLRDGRLTILCEHFSYRDHRGFIVAIESMNAAQAARVSIGPVPAVHMSYPLLLQTSERLFCLPEMSDAHEISLYASERFPDRWVKSATLIKDTAIVDATLSQHGELWWLAGSEVAAFGANCELHLWYAPNITGPWCAHPGNPVKTDIRSARPAGSPFVHDGVLYRPAQDCAQTYGARVMINRVLTLTPLEFREEAVAAVDPDRGGPYPSGLHTLSQVGEATLIDGKRFIFVPAEFRRVLLKKLASAFKISRKAPAQSV
jgi:hypothetical protein